MKREAYRRIHSRYFYIIVVIAFGWIAILSTSGCGGGGGSDDYVTYCDPSQILFTYPENNETDVIGYRLILVEFTGLMNDSTINQSTFTIEDSGGNSVNGEVIFYDREICGIMGCYTRGYANFYPSDNLTPSTQYTATLSGTIQDEEGNDLGCDYHWSFTTRADTGTGTWQSISTTGAPSMGTAVWTGNEMILWDGASGGRYNPTTDTWQPISTSRGTFYGNSGLER